MKWFVIIIIAGFLFYRSVIVKSGNLKFWKLAKEHPDRAYAFFEDNDAFVVFIDKPEGGYKSNLSHGEWDGPFKLHVPSINQFITIYGRVPEYKTAQQNFMRSINE